MQKRAQTVRMRRVGESDRARRDLAGLGIGLGFTLAVVLSLLFLRGYQAFELFFLDVRFRWREKLTPIQQTPQIVHVDIDDQSIAALGRWPWSRKTHATFVSTLSALRPRAIVFDVEFPDPVDPIYDPALVESNIQTVLDAQKMGFHADPELISKRALDFLDRVQAGKVDEKDLMELQRDIEMWGREGAQGQKDLLSAIERARVDDDSVFASAIARAGVVYLPCSFEEETGWVGDPGAVEAVLELLSGKGAPRTGSVDPFLLDAPAIANRLGIRTSDVPPALRGLKEKVAYDRALEVLGRDPAAKDDDVWVSLCPTTMEPVGTLSLPEGEIVRNACRMARGLGDLRAKDALPMPGARIEERNRVRRAFSAVPALARASRGGGFVSVFGDPLDGKLRRLKLVWEAHGSWYPQHMLRTAMDLFDIPIDGVSFEEGPSLVLRPRRGNAIEVPLDEEGRTIMNWVAGQWEEEYFGRHLPYSTVVQLIRRRVEACRILKEVVQKRSIEVEADGADEAFSAIAPGEVTNPKPTDLAPSAALERVKEFQRALMEAVVAAKKAADDEFEELGPEMQKRATGQAIAAKCKDLEVAVAQAGKCGAEADELEARIHGMVAGKVCLVGSTQFSSTDLKPTPLHPVFPGVALYSNLFNMIENRQFIRRVRPLENAGITIFIGILVTLVSNRSGPVRAFLLSAGILLVYALIGFWAFMAHGVWLDFLGPILATTFSFASIATFKEYLAAKDRNAVETLWGQYVSPAVVELLLKNPELQRIFAARRVVTMLFSDVAGFTKESERLDAETVSNLINVYLEEMSAPIVQYDGYLNKYEGDAIMALWGAPIEQPDQAVRACYSALDMQAKLRDIQRGFREKDLPPMHTRIGINTGLVFVGNFGSKRKFDYTAIGDHVNLASRLEGANKAFGTRIMIAEATWEAAKEFIEVRRLGRIRVVGRDTPVGIYELLSRTGELDEAQKKAREAFHRGLEAFVQRRWDEAVGHFQEVLGVVPDDGPAKVYLGQVAECRATDLPPAWDGVVTLESK